MHLLGRITVKLMDLHHHMSDKMVLDEMALGGKVSDRQESGLLGEIF